MTTRVFRGVVHAHSAYSHDGVCNLKTWVELLEHHQLNFAVLTEHVEDFTPDIFANYRAECKQLSTPDRLLIPGVEYTFEESFGRLEVLLIGENSYVENASLTKVWECKKSRQMTAILPHPIKFGTLPQSLVANFDLIEVWNLRYDGGYFLPWKNIILFNEARKEREVYAICGPDYHGPSDQLDLVAVVENEEKLDCSSLIAALRRGEFFCEFRGLNLSSDLQISMVLVVVKSGWRLVRRTAYSLGQILASNGWVRKVVPVELKGWIKGRVR